MYFPRETETKSWMLIRLISGTPSLPTMAKVVSTLFISADGVAEIDPDWHFPYFDDNMGRAVTDKSVFRRLTPAQAAARLTAPDRRKEAAGRRRLGVEHVGPIARFLTAGPTTVVALHRWLTEGPLRLRITRPRLYPALRRLGLDALLAPWGQRKKGAPRASTAPSTPAPSS